VEIADHKAELLELLAAEAEARAPGTAGAGAGAGPATTSPSATKGESYRDREHSKLRELREWGSDTPADTPAALLPSGEPFLAFLRELRESFPELVYMRAHTIFASCM